MNSKSKIKCPDDEQLAELLNGALDVEVESELENHIAECKSCDERLTQLTDSKELGRWQDLLETPPPGQDATFKVTADVRNIVDDVSKERVLEIPGFEIIERIGRGGMGTVYRAIEKNLSRVVALKIIRASSHDQENRERFVAEASAIAKIQHPNVLQIFELGEHGGEPFLVLEYVGGPSLADKTRHLPQDPFESAKYLLQIAKGVESAHANQIIHRDLKPSNILLQPNPDSETGFVAKVADFGLAKEIDGDPHTETSQLVGTPTYMAPEQIAGGRDKPIGFAADVYSLGVILYELLTGYPPFRAGSPFQLLQKIESSAPPRIRADFPQVHADLEAICYKCLEKAPTNRYATATELAEDIQRYLEGKPVLAKPLTVSRRTTKWIARNPMLTALLATLAISLTAGLCGWIAFTRELGQQTKIAKENEKAARESLAKVELANEAKTEMLTFLVEDMLVGATPEGRNDPEMTVVELLSEASDQLDGKFDDPEIEATLRTTIGLSYGQLGKLDKAVSHLEAATQLFSELEDPPIDTYWQASTHLAQQYRDLARYDEQRKCIARILKFTDQLEPFQVIDMKRALIDTEVHHGDRKKAIESSLKLLEEALPLIGEKTTSTRLIYAQLGTAFFLEGDFKQANEYHKRNYEVSKEINGPDHQDTLLAGTNLATTFVRLGDLDGAIEINSDSLERSRESLGEYHPNTLNVQYNLAIANWKRGNRELAIGLLTDAVPAQLKTYGATHWRVLTLHNEIANMKLLTESGESAVTYLDEWFLPSVEKQQNDSKWGQVFMVYSKACHDAGDRERAEEYFELADSIINHPDVKDGTAKKRLADWEKKLFAEESE